MRFYIFVMFYTLTYYVSIRAQNKAKNSVVYLDYYDFNNMQIDRYCYAVLIKKHLLLTAASCVFNDGYYKIETSKERIANVTHILPHSEYMESKEFEWNGIDMAVLKLSKDLNLDSLELEAMPLPDNSAQDGAACVITNGFREEKFRIDNIMCTNISNELYFTSGLCLIRDGGRAISNVTQIMDTVKKDRQEPSASNHTQTTAVPEFYLNIDTRLQNETSNILSDCGMLKGAAVLCNDTLMGIAPYGNCTNSNNAMFIPNIFEQLKWIEFMDDQLSDEAAEKRFVEEEERKYAEQEIEKENATTRLKEDTKKSGSISTFQSIWKVAVCIYVNIKA